MLGSAGPPRPGRSGAPTRGDFAVQGRCASVSSRFEARRFGPSARSLTDRASDYGSEGWGFESLRARQPRRVTHASGRSRSGDSASSSSDGIRNVSLTTKDVDVTAYDCDTVSLALDGSGEPPGVMGRTDSPIAFAIAWAMCPPLPGLTLRTSAMKPMVRADAPPAESSHVRYGVARP